MFTACSYALKYTWFRPNVGTQGGHGKDTGRKRETEEWVGWAATPSPAREVTAARGTINPGSGCSSQLATVVRRRGWAPVTFSCSLEPSPSLCLERWARPETNLTEPTGLSSRGLKASLPQADFTQDWVPAEQVLLEPPQAGLGRSCACFMFYFTLFSVEKKS